MTSLTTAFWIKMDQVDLLTLSTVIWKTVLLKTMRIVHTITLKWVLKGCPSFWLTTSIFFNFWNFHGYQLRPIVSRPKCIFVFIWSRICLKNVYVKKINLSLWLSTSTQHSGYIDDVLLLPYLHRLLYPSEPKIKYTILA